MKFRRSAIAALVLLGAVYLSEVCLAQEEAAVDKDAEASASAPASSGHSATTLAKKTQNPVSDLISVPFENDFGFGAGHDGEFSYGLIIKPVYPQRLSDDWNWIHRALIPILDQPNIGTGTLGEECGLGDIQYQGYLSPAKPGQWIWGVGPVLEFPTATNSDLGSEKWSAGPGAVLLRMDGPWVVGGTINNIWSFAGDGDRDYVNRMTFQPFVNYNIPGGWYLTSAPIITANWNADSEDMWTVPIGGGVGKIVKLGKLPVNVTLQAYYNVERPDPAPDWSVRFQFVFLFPKG